MKCKSFFFQHFTFYFFIANRMYKMFHKSKLILQDILLMHYMTKNHLPWAKIAPNLDITSSCLLLMTCAYDCRKKVTLGQVCSVCCIRIIAEAIRAPWRTKFTGSNMTIGSRRAIASRRPVPAHAIPNAIAAPYLTCGL